MISKKFVSSALMMTTAVWMSGALLLTPSVAQGQTVADLTAQINSLLQTIAALQAQLAALQGGTPVSGGAFAACNFTRDLTLGSKGADVKCLQQGLNASGFAVATTGPGSPGNETEYFGPLTKAALGKWQAANGVSPSVGYFGPITRGAIAALVATPPPTTTPPGGTPPPPANGLLVALAPDTPAGATVPKGASNVPFLKFTISGSGTVNSIVFHRTGAGATGDFASAGINLLDENGVRLTTGRTVNATTHKATFTGLNLSVNGTRTLTLVGSLNTSATPGDRNAFEIMSASDVSGSEVPSGSFPIIGNEMAISGVSIGTIIVASSTNPSNPKVGQQDAKIASFKLTNNSGTDDLIVKSVTLRYSGAVSRANLSNFVLKYAGDVVATGNAINSDDLLVLTFDPELELERGQNKIFDLHADISPSARSGSSETIKFYVDDASDVSARSSLYGFDANVTNNWSSSDPSSVYLDGGNVTIAFNGPVASDIPTSGQDVTLFDFTITSASNIEIRQMSFDVTTTGMGGATNEKLSDFKVVDAVSGAIVMGPYGSDISTTTAGIAFTDTFNISSGESKRLLVKADVGSASALSNDTVQVKLNTFGSTDIRNTDNNRYITPSSDIVPNSTITGNTHTIKSPDLSIALSATPASRTITAGTTDVDLLGFTVKAIADDIQIRTIVISATSTSNTVAGTQDALGSLRLMFDGAQVGNSESLDSSLNATFNDLNFTISEGQTVSVLVNSPMISNNASSTTYSVGIDSFATDITAIDSEGNTLSLSGSVNPTTGATTAITVGTPSLTIARIGAGSMDTDATHVLADGIRTLTRISMKATNGDITVKKLRFGVSNSTSNSTSSAVGDDVLGIYLRKCSDVSCSSTSDISGLTNLPLEGSGQYAGNVRAESSSGFFTIPRGQTQYFTIDARLNTINVGNSEAGDSGQSLVAVIANDSSNQQFVSGNTSLTSFSTTTDGGTTFGVTGNTKTLFRSEPTITLSQVSNWDGALVSGQVPVAEITIGANGNGPIALKAFGINVTANGATVSAPTTSNVTITDIGSSQSITIGSVSGSAITGGNSGDIYFVLSSPEIITPGSPKTYRVEVTASDVSGTANAATLAVKLDRDSTSLINSTTTTALLGADGNFGATTQSWIWSDLSDDEGATESNTQWANGYRIRPFPTNSVTIQN